MYLFIKLINNKFITIIFIAILIILYLIKVKKKYKLNIINH